MALLQLQSKTSKWWLEPIYGSIMLKIFVCHFLTKWHPFSTYEGGKSKKVFLGLPIGHPPPRRDRNRSASPIYSFLTWKQLEEANTRHLLDLGPGWYIDLLWIAKHTFCWGQGCISCGILLSGTWARGVSSEHMENMEMFSCSPT